jgi:adenine-specific DNA-methyltransferase
MKYPEHITIHPSAVRETRKPIVDKLRGGYYTSSELAQWLCDWAIRTPKDRILEPSAGDGAFLTAAAKRLTELGRQAQWIPRQLTGVEIIETEAEKSKARLADVIGKRAAFSIHCADFFAWVESKNRQVYECVVGNPPFIRYHNFPEPSRSMAMAMMKGLGLKPNKLTNIWVPFVIAATDNLAFDGRLALVLPAEILQVSYAGQLRTYLSHNFKSIRIYTCNEMFFEQAEQEVVLLLADGKVLDASEENECAITLYESSSVSKLLLETPRQGNGNGRSKIVHHGQEKWLKYFLSNYEISLMRNLRQEAAVTTLADFASVNVGVVTGQNSFFLLTRDEIIKLGLEAYTLPLIGRTAQLKGAILTEAEHEELSKAGHRVHMFYVTPVQQARLNGNAEKYIRRGEKDGVNKGYKCSIRTPWYVVPSVWQPEGFFFRQIYDFPRVVLNETAATSTDTIHRMNCHVPAKTLLPCLYTHLMAASAEIEGRSYGGGVLELEPTEATRLLVPKKLSGGLSQAEIDKLVRTGQLEVVLRENDKLILQDTVGLNQTECKALAGIWHKLRNRRRSRGRAGVKG